MRIIDIIGNQQLLTRHKTLFLCSKHAPYGCYGTVFEWVESLTDNDCVMCFNTSELEEEVLQALLVARIPTILLTVGHFSRHTFNLQIETAWIEQRLAVVVLERDEPHGAGPTPKLRNRYAIAQANNIVCGYFNPRGSIAPLLRETAKEVTHLLDDRLPIAAEPTQKHAKWTVGEDKQLLRLHYADMGLHAMHRALGRPYAAIRQRIHALALCDEALMGREFEDYVLELLFDGHAPAWSQPLTETARHLSLLEWRGDKILGDIFPQSNSLPDLVLAVDGQPVAIECKWRKRLSPTIADELLTPDRLNRFTQYATDNGTLLLLLLGTGGLPSYPDHLYLVPITQVLNLDTLKNSEITPDKLKSAITPDPR